MIKLGIGNYGMKSMQTAEAVQTIARIGYDAVELTMMPGWPSEPTTLVKPERQRIADLMDELGMVLPSLLEQIPIIGDEAEHAENLERLKRDAELGHDVSPKTPPVIQTHLGGKSQEWEKQKELVVKRLGDWAEVGRSTGTVICIKVHHKNLMDSSDKAVWVMEEVDSPWVRMLYDYSHMEVVGEGMAETMDLLLPYTAIISVKDSNRDPQDFQRLLPGDGIIDYVDYYRRLNKAGYTGCTIVEVSGQFHKRPDYDPIGVAEYCYEKMTTAMKAAEVR